MTPSQKRSLRVSWYGLSIPWPLYSDVHGRPYFLSVNKNGRAYGVCKSLAPVQQQQHEVRR